MRLLFILLISPLLTFAQFTVESVPNPKSSSTNGYVSNPNGIISNDDQGSIDNICLQIEETDSFQVAFVVLNSIGEEVPKDFAGRLFNSWNIGHAGRDDGLLVLFIKDQRRIEFETGYGTEAVLTDYACVQIQENEMIPYFKSGDYSKGLLEGAKAIQNALRGQTVDRFEVKKKILNEKEVAYEAQVKKENAQRNWIIYAAVWHAIGLILFLIGLLIIRFRYDPYAKYNVIKYFAVWIWALFFPITHIFIVIVARSLRQRYRDMIRFSGKTGEIMRKLSEEDEDEYLSRGQITEELVKSVDYDVWITDGSDDVLLLPYRPIFTKYTKCKKCGYKTYFKVYDKQTLAPTYISAGKGERKHECVNCKHVDKKTYRIPRLRKTARTSGVGGWISSSGGGGFSGGGSWGGGFSGGGGGGSSW